MNIIRMAGGLGNQMFQYALFLSFLNKGIPCRFDDFSEYEGHENARPIQLGKFGIEYPRASRREVNEFTNGQPDLLHKLGRKLFGRRSREYHEQSCNFDPKVKTLDHAYLTGYFQSEKYFSDVRKQVRSAYMFPEKPGPVWDKITAEIESDAEIVSVHIRRGDYLTTAEVFGGICTDAYYDRAIRYMKERLGKVHFLVFCDDADWAARMAKDWERRYGTEHGDLAFTAPTGYDADEGFTDFYLMSRCSHQILANSSFSWWSAYLNRNPQKIVLVPPKWLKTQDCTDIYTDDMIRLST